jgi:putative membrane protein
MGGQTGADLGVMTLLSSVVYGVLGVLLMLAGYKIFDAIHPIDFVEELKKGNVAVGLASAGILIGVALIVAAAIS